MQSILGLGDLLDSRGTKPGRPEEPGLGAQGTWPGRISEFSLENNFSNNRGRVFLKEPGAPALGTGH